MPTAKFTTVLGANEVNQNVMAGSQFEFMGRPTRIQIYAIADTGDVVDIEVFFGQELQMAPAQLGTLAATTGPIVPDDLLVDDIAAPGDRITIRLTETAAVAATNVRTLVVLTPVA